MNPIEIQLTDLEKNYAIMHARGEEQQIYIYKNVEKLEEQVNKMGVQTSKLELIINKWINYFLGSISILIICMSILGWSTQRIITVNDQTDQTQDQAIIKLQTEIVNLETRLKLLEEKLKL